MNGRNADRSWEETLGDLDWTLRNAKPRPGQRANPRVTAAGLLTRRLKSVLGSMSSARGPWH